MKLKVIEAFKQNCDLVIWHTAEWLSVLSYIRVLSCSENSWTKTYYKNMAGHQWLTPVILATQEADIRKIMVWSQPGKIAYKTISQKNLHKNKVGGVAQGEGPDFKPQ
jgi:hypothetical protein